MTKISLNGCLSQAVLTVYRYFHPLRIIYRYIVDLTVSGNGQHEADSRMCSSVPQTPSLCVLESEVELGEGNQSSMRVPPEPKTASLIRGDMTRRTQP